MPSEGDSPTCTTCGCHNCFHCNKYSTISIENRVSLLISDVAGQSRNQIHPLPASTLALAPLPITTVTSNSPPSPNQAPLQPMPSQVFPVSRQSRANMEIPPPLIPPMLPGEEQQPVIGEARDGRVPVPRLRDPERKGRQPKLSKRQKSEGANEVVRRKIRLAMRESLTGSAQQRD